MGKPKSSGTSAGAAALKKKMGSWGKSGFSARDLKTLSAAEMLPDDKEKVRLPGDEVIPRPPPGWCVMFMAFVVRGLSLPAHEFLRGLLFIYDIQLHHLTPNSILHIACFITLCECFLLE